MEVHCVGHIAVGGYYSNLGWILAKLPQIEAIFVLEWIHYAESGAVNNREDRC